MSIKIHLVPPPTGLIDGEGMAGALDRYEFRVHCDVCGRPIRDDPNAWIVWSAAEAWEGGRYHLAHGDCRDTLLRRQFDYADLPDIRHRLLRDLPEALAVALAVPRPSKGRR